MSGPGTDTHLAHHFDTEEQQFESGKLGMWLFLVTEILLFGGLFCWYSVYRANHPEIFAYAHQYLDKVLGGINTLVLICSSLTMAWAVRAAQLGQKELLVKLLGITLVFAGGFLVIKYVEYSHKWHEGLLWISKYSPSHGADRGGADHGEGEEKMPVVVPLPGTGEESSLIAPAAVGPQGLVPEDAKATAHSGEEPANVGLFFSIYFVMTGLHGLHVIAGMAVIGWLLARARKGHFGPDYFTPVDFGGLYWHLVDVVWIFLFPLLYLIH